MVFVGDDLGAWLVGLVADAGRRKLTALVLGSDQERALRSAAAAAVRNTVADVVHVPGIRVPPSQCGEQERAAVRRPITSKPEFEVLFLHLYKNDPTDWPADVFDILDAFFADVDEYCADAALRARVNGIDAGELRSRAVRTLERLKAMGG